MKSVRAIDFADAEPIGPRGPGRRTSGTLASIYLRNALLAEAALVFHRGASSNAAASAIHRRLALYRSGGWRRHRVEEQLPRALVGRIEELLWHLLKQRDALPSERTIRAALDAAKKVGRSLFVANGGHHVEGRCNARGRSWHDHSHRHR